MKKIHLIIGARPNIMKIAPLYKELMLCSNRYTPVIIHTGQHYDERMNELFFEELSISKPDFTLDVGSASHSEQTARIMERYEEVLFQDKPDLVIVAGDVNSTMACAIVAVKQHIPVAHLEAGLRSYDNSMPEEINRIVTDSISDILLTPSIDADENLVVEGIPRDKIHFVGNIMIDSLMKNLLESSKSTILCDLCLEPESYALLTLHRPSNVDNVDSLKLVIEIIKQICLIQPVVIPLHPRTEKNIHAFGLDSRFYSIPNLTVLPPLGYLDMLKLEMNATLIITDSGGLQEESTFMGIPCLTIRENTERPITVTQGTNILITKLDKQLILAEVYKVLSGNGKKGTIPDLWDGKTSIRVIDVLDKFLSVYHTKE
ncbi:MAG: UDP-N-acetylglucosamine 2-epimerase (non-hydrolyzing) [Candidatus Cloacimonetes bacterium]|nr:UDP-N-acetylglucosamine 2-epimerase (non-hydrolyzing) [Candidatus Cloacimonadota bacterium]